MSRICNGRHEILRPVKYCKNWKVPAQQLTGPWGNGQRDANTTCKSQPAGPYGNLKHLTNIQSMIVTQLTREAWHSKSKTYNYSPDLMPLMISLPECLLDEASPYLTGLRSLLDEVQAQTLPDPLFILQVQIIYTFYYHHFIIVPHHYP